MRISFKRNGFIALASMLSFAVYAGDNLPLATAASGTNGSIQVSEHGVDTSNEIQQARVIQGTVLEEGTNEPLIGVNVVVKGTTTRYGSDNLVGKKVLRNNMHKQNNFSMFWTAEALLECYRLTSNKEYLDYGQRTLDELLMTQASWQPPYMYVNVLGGFGVLNADGEWNDSRESLFSELIIQYGKLLDKPEYIERGYAALKASFVMMYCTENPQTKQQWEKVHPFFASEDYGFMMENYGHGGRTNPAGEGMGEFTIYDWGNGAAAEAYNRILDKFGKIE